MYTVYIYIVTYDSAVCIPHDLNIVHTQYVLHTEYEFPPVFLLFSVYHFKSVTAPVTVLTVKSLYSADTHAMHIHTHSRRIYYLL